jgi:peptidoglycan/xylan/chitin deacetylase (PgdA/CDA1 family)
MDRVALPRQMPRFLKRGLRSSAYHAARMSGILARRERGMVRDLTILTYHRVLPESRCTGYPFPSLAMPLGAFREQVRWLATQGEILPLGEALARNGRPSQRPRFALTFDDGYSDAREIVAGVLEELGVRGTFFVITGFVGTRELQWFDRAALLFAAVPAKLQSGVVQQVCGERRLEQRPPPGASGAAWTRYLKGCLPEERLAILSALERALGGAPPLGGFSGLSVAQLVELHRNGHEIGSHTVSHAMLPELDDAALRSELEDSREALCDWLGHDVAGFCYPNGDHDERSVAAVARAGHHYACTTRDGVHPAGSDPFRIRRVHIDPRRVTDGAQRLDLTAFRGELCGLYRRR